VQISDVRIYSTFEHWGLVVLVVAVVKVGLVIVVINGGLCIIELTNSTNATFAID
jgi:hypothetical protein